MITGVANLQGHEGYILRFQLNYYILFHYSKSSTLVFKLTWSLMPTNVKPINAQIPDGIMTNPSRIQTRVEFHRRRSDVRLAGHG